MSEGFDYSPGEQRVSIFDHAARTTTDHENRKLADELARRLDASVNFGRTVTITPDMAADFLPMVRKKYEESHAAADKQERGASMKLVSLFSSNETNPR